MIPKTIHYCWFGRQPVPPLLTKCIESWKQHLPEYELVLWNEDRFDISHANLFVQQAYNSGKYAFVSDYVRMYALYHYGGIYLDTDVEVVKSFDDLLDYDVFFGFENQKMIGSGLGCGAKPKHWFIQEIMNEYEQTEFIKKDGTFDLTPCPIRETKLAEVRGLRLNDRTQIIDGVAFLSSRFLNPRKYIFGVRKGYHHSIHHNYASWITQEGRYLNVRHEDYLKSVYVKYESMLGKNLGYIMYKIHTLIFKHEK